jgi:hypothetical protein
VLCRPLGDAPCRGPSYSGPPCLPPEVSYRLTRGHQPLFSISGPTATYLRETGVQKNTVEVGFLQVYLSSQV